MPPRGSNSANSANSVNGANSVNNATENAANGSNAANTTAARQARKRRAGMAPKMRANKAPRTQMSVEDVSDLEKLLKTLEECADDDNRGVWLTLELALNRCTFEHSLRSMFADEQGQSAVPQHVPVVPRAYEESFMHEHDPATEQPCVMGNQCECMFIDKDNRFIAPQFILPDMQVRFI